MAIVDAECGMESLPAHFCPFRIDAAVCVCVSVYGVYNVYFELRERSNLNHNSVSCCLCTQRCARRTVQHHKSLDINFWVCYVKSLRKELPFAIVAVAAAAAAANFHISHLRWSCAFEMPTDRPTDRAHTERREDISYFLHHSHFSFSSDGRCYAHTRVPPTQYTSRVYIEPIHAQRFARAQTEPSGCLAPTREHGDCYRFRLSSIVVFRLVYGRIDLFGGNLKKAKNNSILEIHFYWIL